MKRVSLCLALAFAFLIVTVSAFYDERVLLKDLKAVTLTQGQMTKARRVSPIPQLQCVGGSAQSSNYLPRVVQCVQVGFDGYDAQWECKAELDDAVQFGSVSVNCEGYSHTEDPYVLRGSCGLEYTLEYTRKGQQYGQPQYNQYQPVHYGDSSNSSWIGSFISFAILVGVIYVCLRVCCSAPASNGYDAPNIGGAGYGGPGGYGYGGGMPPGGGGGPYGPSAPYGGGGSPYGGGGYPSPSYAQPAGPGFWGGFTAGGLLGYLFRPRTPYYGTGYAPRPTYGGATFAPSAPSGGSRTASGFGGTRRR